MRYLFFWFCLSFSINDLSLAQPKVVLSKSFVDPVSKELAPFSSLSSGQYEALLKGEVISEGKVSSPTDKEQQMSLLVAGIHPRNCTRAMRKLSRYENYHEYINFIKTSTYNDKTQKLSFTIDHALLPYAMILSFKLPRITKEGHYPFTFEHGFLKDLTGTIIVKEVGRYCLLGLKTDWRGPESPMPDTIFATFVQTVGKLGLEHLIRVSLF